MLRYRVTVKKGGNIVLTKHFQLTKQDPLVGLREAIDELRRKHPNVGLMDGDVSFSIDPDA